MALTADDPSLLAALDSLLPGAVRRDTNALGTRELERELDDLFAGAGLLLAGEEVAVFDILSRGARVLGDEIATARTALAAIYTLGQDLRTARGRRASTLSSSRAAAEVDLAPLQRARAALAALETALAIKDTGLASSSHPAYARYRDETQRFLAGPGQEVRAAGALAPTVEEARALLPDLVRGFTTALEDFLSHGAALIDGLASFYRANVLSKIASPAVTNARADLDTRLAALEGMTEVARRAALRDLVVGVLNARGALRGALLVPTDADTRALEGRAFPTADAAHPAVNRAVVGSVVGPHLLSGADTRLLLTVGGIATDVALSPSPIAHVDGVNVEPFELAAAPYDNRTLVLDLDGTPRTLVLSAGTRSAASIATEIDAAWATYGYTAAASGPTGAQAVVVRATGWREGSAVAVSTDSPAALVLGFARGAGVAARKTRTREVVTEVTALAGSTVEATEALEARWSGTLYTDPEPTGWLVLRATGAILSSAPGRFEFELDDPGGTTAHVRVGDALAFESGPYAGTAWTIDIVTSSLVFEAVGDAAITPVYSPSVAVRIYAPRRADPLRDVVAALARSTVDITPSSGLVCTVTRTGGDEWPATGVDQVITSLGAVLVVTGRAGDVLTATAPYPLPSAAGMPVYLLPSRSSFAEGNALEVVTGPLAGRYDIAEVGGDDAPRSCSGELVLFDSLPFAALARTPSTRISAPVVVSYTRLSLAARDTSSTAGSIALAVGGASAAFTPTALSATPTTEWLALDEGVRPTIVGDRLRRTASGATVEVEVVERPSPELARVSPLIPVGETWDFSALLEPYARAAPGPREAYRAFSADWFTWTETGPAAAYSAELSRRAGLVASAANPMPVDYQLADLLTWVEAGLVQLDLAAAISSTYRVAKAPGVDDLIRAFREKGAHRAVNLLYRGDFEGFFALDVATVSYSGTLAAAVAETARLDMPVRKVDRSDTTTQRLIGSAPTTDFEFSTADIDESPAPDVPQD